MMPCHITEASDLQGHCSNNIMFLTICLLFIGIVYTVINVVKPKTILKYLTNAKFDFSMNQIYKI